MSDKTNMDEVQEIMSARLEALFKDLPKKAACELLEELIGDYCSSVFGIDPIPELRKFGKSKRRKDYSMSITTLAKDRLLIVSRNGVHVENTIMVDNKLSYVIREMTPNERDQDLNN